VDLPALLRRAEEVGGVHARPGYVRCPDIPGLFNEARVVVTPYLRGSQSGVVHLAYTFDRPVVATTVGDIPTVVRDGETGLLVPKEAPEALAAALAALLADPARAASLAAAGRAEFERAHAEAPVLARWRGFLRSVAPAAPPPARAAPARAAVPA
jgi:glycosyltransferase involved in cell wall biosynthesis